MNIDKYQVCIEWSEEDGAFLASLPDLPGCMADGPTQDEALANVREVAALWIETAQQLGRAVPAPKRLSSATLPPLTIPSVNRVAGIGQRPR